MAEIDTSAEAVKWRVRDLRTHILEHRCSAYLEAADLLEALLAQRDAAVARAEKAEGERDEAKAREVILNDEFMTSSMNADARLATEAQAHENASICINDIYFMLTGRSPAWSDKWGFAECFDELKGARHLLSQTARDTEAQLTTALARVAELEDEVAKLRAPRGEPRGMAGWSGI